MIEIHDGALQELRKHAAACAPRECCGLLLLFKGKQRYWPCTNEAKGEENFIIAPADWAAAEDVGEILAICHSHPFAPPLPSPADLTMCEKLGLPWIIINHPTGRLHQFAPSGYQAPLTGRTFHHGILDCYSLIRDYYRLSLDIVLPDFERPDNWWLPEVGLNLYEENFAAAGFHQVPAESMRLHDVLLMQIASDRSNHGAVYVGDGRILQHVYGCLSSRYPYGGYWRKATTKVLRHQEVI